MATNDTPLFFKFTNNLVENWINAGGGVMLPGSPMGCGLNVLSCIGLIDRNNLANLISQQLQTSPGGLMLAQIIDNFNQDATNVLNTFLPANFNVQHIDFYYRQYYDIDVTNSREHDVRSIMHSIAFFIENSTDPSRFKAAIIKLILHKPSGLGHTILMVFDKENQEFIIFDPQKCTPRKPKIYTPEEYVNYLVNSPYYVGISFIKRSEREHQILEQHTQRPHIGGKRKTKRNKRVKNKYGKTKRNKRSKSKRNNKRGGKTEESVKNSIDFKYLFEFVNEGEYKLSDSNKQLLEKALKSIDEFNSSEDIKF